MAFSDWRNQAMCADPAFRDLPGWFPNGHWPLKKRAREVQRVMRICSICPVIAECAAEVATQEEPAGVWAGRIYGRGSRRTPQAG